jgi:hypothetical protein
VNRQAGPPKSGLLEACPSGLWCNLGKVVYGNVPQVQILSLPRHERKQMTNSTSTASTGSGIGFAGLLTIVFIVLKLTHVIDWSWLWVLSPLWISALLSVAILVVLFIAFVIVKSVSKK